MRMIPKASKVRVTFYKGITLWDIAIGLAALAIAALFLSTNFSWRAYPAIGSVCVAAVLYVEFDGQRLYVQIAYFLRYVFSRKRYSSSSRGSSSTDSIIPYREVKEGFVYDRDGTEFAAIEIDPINFSMLSEDRQSEIVDSSLSPILNEIGPGEEWFLCKEDRPLILDDEMKAELRRSDSLSRAKERGRLSVAEYESRQNLLQSRLDWVDDMNSSDIMRPRYFLALLGNDGYSVSEKLDKAITRLSSSGIKAHRLLDQELFLFIKAGYGEAFDERLEAKKVSTPNSVRFGLLRSKQPSASVTSLAITSYPQSVPEGWGERLFSLPGTKVTMRMRPLEKAKAIKRIDNAILEVETKNVGKESQLNDQDTHLESLRGLLDDIQTSNETLFDTVTIVTVFDKPGSSANRRYAKQAIREMGFGYSEMAGRQMDAYVSSLISSKELTHLSLGIQTSSLAACFPFGSDTLIDDDGLFVGDDDMPCFIDFFKRDLKHVNSNMVIVGQSGSGKSYAAKTILSNLSTCGAKVYVLDPESEYGGLARKLGGSSIDASDGSKGRINPLEIMGRIDEGEAGNAYYAQLQFLEQFYKETLSGISQDALEALNRLSEEAYLEKGIGPGTNLSSLSSLDYPTFEDVCSLCDKKLSSAKDAYDINNLKTVANYLSRFRKGGRDSNLWNGPTTFSPKENFIAFDFQRLLSNRNESTANAQMLLLLRYIEGEVIANRERNSREKSSSKVVVAIDEAHLFIDEKYPVALDFMFQLAKRIRKYDGMLIVITQNVRDFGGSPETAKKAMDLISVCQYSLIFSLPPSDMNDLLALYANAGGISEKEKETIASLNRGDCFLISGPSERGEVGILATKEAESMFG
jgi:conjugal transfer ATP-binding protein TraC